MFFIIFFAVGIFTGSFFDLSVYFGLLFVFLALTLKLLKLNFNNLVFFVGMLAFGLGFSWYAYEVIPPDLSDFQIGRQVLLEGVVADEADERENYTRLVLEVGSGAKILIYTGHYPKFNYGDKLKISGELRKPEKIDDFDWPAYLAKDDVYLEMFYPDIKLLSSGNGSRIKRYLFSLKADLLSNVSRVIPEPHASFLGGLTFGAKQSMPKGLQDDFRKTGIIHIVVLSGYNVTIVADAIMRVFSFLPSFFGIGLGALGIAAFAVMAGASATVVRASIMAVFVLLARATGRIYEITIALFAAGFLMILHNPKILRFDSSFQLSFLATMALIWVAPIVEPKLKFFPKKFHIREFATATISTQIFVLPLLLYKMGLFSAVSVPVNLLILIFVPATMLFGFLTAAAGFVWYYLSLPFGWITYVLLHYELKVVEVFASLPFASFAIDNFPLWVMLSVYAGYAILIFYGKDKKIF